MGKSISIDDSAGTLINGLEISVRAAGANGKFVAVTGADGFIGSHIVKILLGKGYMVRGTVLDVDLANFLTELPKAAENLSLFKAELSVKGAFDDVFEGCDCVFHVASPTLVNQREMKMPETEMIEDAVQGTLNVLKSCEKAGVKAVVLTSSMSAASPGSNRPRIINESYWSDPEVQMKTGHYYNASKTMAERAAVDFVANMSTELAFRLVRICPTFTVGPMLQPTVNSSMYRFAAICDGIHHKQVPNGSRSLIDVRDTAAHHVAAYEKGLEGRIFSTTEAWPWTLIYQALKFYRPAMHCPVPLPFGIDHRPVREYSKTRMNALGVNTRSMMQILGDAVTECDLKNLTSGDNLILKVCGYYDLDSGKGQFVKVDVQYFIKANNSTSLELKISYVIGNATSVVSTGGLPISPFVSSGKSQGMYTYKLENVPDVPNFDLTFQVMPPDVNSQARITVAGSIDQTPITGASYITYVPISVFDGTYTASDGGTVTFALREGSNSSISFSDGTKPETFSYDPIKRKFEFDDKDYTKRLYMNVASDIVTGVGPGSGVLIRFVQFRTVDPKGTGSTQVYLSNTRPKVGPIGPVNGAESLEKFGGYYPLGIGFLSIGGSIGPKNMLTVGVSTDGQNSTQYPSFTFANNTLTFPQEQDAPTITLTEVGFESETMAVVSVSSGGPGSVSLNYFSVAPLLAFGNRTLTGKNSSSTTLEITPTDGASKIVYTVNGSQVFETTEYEYNPVEQCVYYDHYRLNFCYNLAYGVTCGVTSTQLDNFNSVLFAYA